MIDESSVCPWALSRLDVDLRCRIGRRLEKYMINIRILSEEHLPFAIRLTDTMSWNLTEEDFRFMIDLEPDGCFIALVDGEPVGLATTIAFGEIGWIGNVIVEKNYRNQGVGSRLVKHGVNYLMGRAVKTVAIYAYENAVPFYRRLGFKSDLDFIVLEGEGVSKQSARSTRRAEDRDLSSILALDSLCFGGSRERLLKQWFSGNANLCYVGYKAERLSGFVFARRYDEMVEVGPLVCAPDSVDVADDLLCTVLGQLEGLEIHLCVSEKAEDVLSVLKGLDFAERFRVVRMFRGRAFAEKGYLPVAESLERG